MNQTPGDIPADGSADAPRLPRRAVLKWFAAASAASCLPDFGAVAAPEAAPAKGYGTDPKIAQIYNPGDFWPLTLSSPQRQAVVALCDLVLPADHLGPAASEVRVPEFIDEWVSAPYADQQKDRDIVLPGLAWLDEESKRRYGKEFSKLSVEQQTAIANDICWAAEAKSDFKKAASFFNRFRALAASAYYGTEAGWKAIGYVGNTPMISFDGPPPEVLARLGVEQTVK
jgi:hypothetical protein